MLRVRFRNCVAATIRILCGVMTIISTGRSVVKAYALMTTAGQAV